MLCFIFMSSGLLICYFTTSIYSYIIPAILFGAGTGLRTLVNSFLMVELLPNNYGLAAGLGNCGGAFSIVFWGWTGQMIINDENIKPQLEVKEYNRVVHYFDDTVTDRTQTFFITTFMISALAFFLPILVKKPFGQHSI